MGGGGNGEEGAVQRQRDGEGEKGRGRTVVVTDLSYSPSFALLAAVLPFTGKRRTSILVPLPPRR